MDSFGLRDFNIGDLAITGRGGIDDGKVGARASQPTSLSGIVEIVAAIDGVLALSICVVSRNSRSLVSL